jgi:hypothetical protein
VLVIDAAPAVTASDELVRERVRALLASGLTPRDAAATQRRN